MSDAPTPAPETPVAAPAVADPPKPATPTVSRAKGALAAYRAKSAPKAEPAKDAAPAPAIPADIASAADRWRAHEKSESARIKAAAAALDEADQALINSEPDVARKAALLARLTPAAGPERTPAKPRAAGGPPSASAIDWPSTIRDPQAMAEAKAKDPEGFAKFFSSLMQRTGGRKSTLEMRGPKPA